MIARIYEVDVNGGTSQVDEIIIPERDGAGVPTVGAGHQVPYHVFFAGLDFVTHQVRLYTAGATLLHQYDVTPTKDIVTLFDPIRFRIGDGGPNTPAAGDTAYVNAAMAGLAANEYIAIRTGYGPVVEGIHIVNNVLGGFQLFQPGDVFSGDPAEEWTIIMQPKVVQNYVNDSVVGKLWGPTSGGPDIFLDINANMTYDPGHLRKLMRLSGSAVYTFGAVDVPPIGYIFRFTHFGAYTPGDPWPKVKFDNAPLLWGNTTKTELEVPFSCTPEFTWDGTNWNCSNYQTPPATAPVAGTIIYSGAFVIGDLSEGDVTIVHGQNILYPYRVFCEFYSRSANPARDNTIGKAVIKSSITANQFKVTIQEIFGEVQNVELWYILVKA